MTRKTFGIYYPTSKACEVLEPRWTLLILCELWSRNTRFNENPRALLALSPALLSKWLKELETVGMIDRVENPAQGTVDCFRRQKAIDIEPILEGMARWAQKYIDAESRWRASMPGHRCGSCTVAS